MNQLLNRFLKGSGKKKYAVLPVLLLLVLGYVFLSGRAEFKEPGESTEALNETVTYETAASEETSKTEIPETEAPESGASETADSEAALSKTESSAGHKETETEESISGLTVEEDGTYSDKDHVALYIHIYGKLPENYISKKEAEKLGWSAGDPLWDYADGKSIGGSRFGNYEGLLPEAEGRSYTECDIDYDGERRNAKRIVFSNDGLIYYTEDHYESFELLYDGSEN